jgi:hypothetical protein
MWEYIVTHSAIIINGLDLASFIMITPRLVEVLDAPMITWWVITMPPIIFITGLILFKLILLVPLTWPVWARRLYLLLLTISVFVVIGRMTRSKLFKYSVSAFTAWAGTHMTALGIGLFFFSRLLAFFVALYPTH